MAYATFEDLQARSPELLDETRAQALLDDASAMIYSLASSVGVAFDASDEQAAALLRKACCASVLRALSSCGASVSSSTETVGPFSQTYSYANPSGDLYLTASEKKELGISRQVVGSLRPVIGGGDV